VADPGINGRREGQRRSGSCAPSGGAGAQPSLEVWRQSPPES